MKLGTGVGLTAYLLVSACSVQALTLGQVDTFASDTQGWIGYGPVSYVPSGGPNGSGDGYLRVSANGGSGKDGELGAGSPLSRWAGDYTSEGVKAISMDLLNLGPVDLEMRIFFAHNYGTITSTVPCIVPPDGQWHHAIFGFTANDLEVNGDINAILKGTRFEIRHQPGLPSLNTVTTKITSSIGIDNVTAFPEPMTILFCVAGSLIVIRRRIAA